MDNSPPKSPSNSSYGSESNPIDANDGDEDLPEFEEEKVPRSLKRERAGKGPLSFIDLVDEGEEEYDDEIIANWRKFYDSLLCTETYADFSDPRPQSLLQADHGQGQRLHPDRHLPSVRQLPGSPPSKDQVKGKQ